MIARAREADLPFGWVTADEAYGQVGRLHSWLEEHDLAHMFWRSLSRRWSSLWICDNAARTR